MKKYKQLVTGILVGGLLFSSGNALAENDMVPTIMNWVKYKINGEEKSLPSGYTTLNYKDHTYVPTRFIAEQLGAEIEWDDETKTVVIHQEIPKVEESKEEVNNEEPQESTEEDTTDSTAIDLSDYDELPVSKTINGVRLELYDIEEQTNYTKFYFILKNTQDMLVQLQQGTAYFQSEYDKYTNKDMSGQLYWKDEAWYKDIDEDEDQEGYIMLPPIPDDEKYGTFYVEVLENSLNGETMKYEFDIKW